MSEQLDPEILEMDNLLRRTADAFSFPPTPDMGVAVDARLRQPAPSLMSALTTDLLQALRGWSRRPAPRIAAVAVAAALVVLGMALAIPQSRTALADLFGLSHVRVEKEAIPPDGERPPALRPEEFAKLLTVEAAQRAANFTLRFPTYPDAIGDPDAVYLDQFGQDTLVILSYAEAGFDLYQSRLRGSFFKGVPEGIVEVAVAGVPGLWVPKGGHGAAYLDPEGELIPGSERFIERGTLLWEKDGITYRLETSLSQEEAIRVAASLQ